MTRPDWIALVREDGTLSAWAMASDGGTLAEAEAAVSADVSGAEIRAVLGAWEVDARTPILASGLPGGTLRTVPCTPLPETIAAEDRDGVVLHPVPSLMQQNPRALTEGAETAIAGFLALNPGFDGVICRPGGRTVWAQVSAGEVVSFQCAVTAALRAALVGPAPEAEWDGDAFADALSATMSRPETLATRLASIRAGHLLGDLSQVATVARYDGALIGADLAAAKPYWLGMPVALVGSARACRPYAAGLEAQGVTPLRTRGDACLRAGLEMARRRI